MSRTRTLIVITILLSVIASVAYARTTLMNLSVERAVRDSEKASKILDVPYYMKGQDHPEVARSLGIFRTKKSTNAYNKSDEAACGIAFLSSLLYLQRRVKTIGGGGLIEITSVTDSPDLESATDYRCAAGNVIARVGLSGRIVKFK